MATKPDGTKVRREGATVAAKRVRGPENNQATAAPAPKRRARPESPSVRAEPTIPADPIELVRRLYGVAVSWSLTAQVRGSHGRGGMSSIAFVLSRLVRFIEGGDIEAIAETENTVEKLARRRARGAKPGRPSKDDGHRDRLTEGMRVSYTAVVKAGIPREAHSLVLAQNFLALLFHEPSSPITRELRARKQIGTEFPFADIAEKATMARIADKVDPILDPGASPEEVARKFVSKALGVLGYDTRDLHARADRRAQRSRPK